jgi:hypothetical protein
LHGRFLLRLLGRVPVERLLVVGEIVVALDLDLGGGQLLDASGGTGAVSAPVARRGIL